MTVKFSIKDLMKTYYNVLMLSESKRATMKSSSSLPLTEKEVALLEQDLLETEQLLHSLRNMITNAYGVATFQEVASEVLRHIEADPYHRFTASLHGTGSEYDYSMKAVAGNFFSFDNKNKKNDIN
jgi:hypothetical protein